MKRKTISKLCLLLMLALTAGMIYSSGNFTQAKAKKKVLVAYFSATGTTKSAAKKIKRATGGKLFEIKPKKAYTAADLDYNSDNCRANLEQNDSSARPEIKGKVKNIRKYDVIFLGYPIWWGKEPKVIKSFLESYNLKGKKIVTFCTSGSSGISGSIKGVKASAKKAKVVKGRDLTEVSYNNVKQWVKKQIK